MFSVPRTRNVDIRTPFSFYIHVQTFNVTIETSTNETSAIFEARVFDVDFFFFASLQASER